MATLEGPDPSRIPELEDCVAYFRREHDLVGEFLSRVAIGLLELMQGSSGLDTADRHLQRAKALAETLKSPFLTSMALHIAGQVFLARGDVPGAIATFEASLQAAKDSGEVLSESAALFQLGWAMLLLGDNVSASDFFVQQMRISSAVGHQQGIANGLDGMFAVAVAVGDIERAGTTSRRRGRTPRTQGPPPSGDVAVPPAGSRPGRGITRRRGLPDRPRGGSARGHRQGDRGSTRLQSSAA